MVTQPVVEAIGESEYLEFEPIGEVALKGFPPAGRAVRRACEEPGLWVKPDRAREELTCARRTIVLWGGQRLRRPWFRSPPTAAWSSAARPASCWSPAAPDSACAAAGARRGCSAPRRSSRCTSTTACATPPTPTSAPPASSARRSRIDLHVERLAGRSGPGQPPGRGARRPLRGRRAAARRAGADWIATGHTRTDVAETMLYRLAASPGRRALLGLPPGRARSSGRCSRSRASRRARSRRRPGCRSPTTRPTTTRASPATGSAPRCCRCCAELSPAAERNIAETRAELAEEAELLERVVAEALEAGAAPARRHRDRRRTRSRAGEPGAAPARAAGAGRARRGPPGPAGPRARGRDRAARGRAGGRRGRARRRPAGGLRGGLDRASRPPEPDAAPAPEAVALPVPGSCRFGGWEVRAELRPAPVEPAGPELATLDAAALGTGRSRSAPGARATGSARSGSAAEDAAGPVHRPAGPALAARRAAGRRWPAARSPGSPGSRSPRSSGSTDETTEAAVAHREPLRRPRRPRCERTCRE